MRRKAPTERRGYRSLHSGNACALRAAANSKGNVRCAPHTVSIFSTRYIADFGVPAPWMRGLLCRAKHGIGLQEFLRSFLLSRRAEFSAHAIEGATLRALTWQDREERRQKMYAWSSSHRRTMRYRCHRHVIRSFSNSSEYLHARRPANSLELRRNDGNRMLLQNEETSL